MTKAVFTLWTAQVRDRAIAMIRTAPIGYRVTIGEPKRTDAQNDLMWPRIRAIAKKVDWDGDRLSEDDWKDILTAGFREERVVPGITPGTVVRLGLRTSKLSKSEMGQFLDFIDAFAAERGVRLDADEQAA